MQIKKDNILENVLAAAREEFLEKGFKDTNMRTIAKKSSVGLSNIYNYFKNKDEIFLEVLQPILLALEKLMDAHNSEEYLSMEVFTSKDYLQEHTNMYVNLIQKFKIELKILLFKSHGSSLENYIEEYTDKHTAVGLEYMRLMKERYPQLNIDISEFFIHTMSSWWLSIVGELVMHDLPVIEMERFLSEFMEFATAGWKKVMLAG